MLDTNAALALFWYRDPALAALAQALTGGAAVPLVSAPLLSEWERELARLAQLPSEYARAARHWETAPSAAQAAAAYAALAQTLPHPDAEWCQKAALAQCTDPDDQKFLELAAWSGAPLITRDKALLRLRRAALRHGFEILAPTGWPTEPA